MGRYNAERQAAQGRMTHDRVERLIHFGPGRDSGALSRAIGEVVGLRLDPDNPDSPRLLERTRRGNSYRMPAGLGDVIGITLARTTYNSERAATTELASVHDTLSGIVRHVGASALAPEEIAPAIRERWQATRLQALTAEAPKAPEPAATPVAPEVEPVLQAA